MSVLCSILSASKKEKNLKNMASIINSYLLLIMITNSIAFQYNDKDLIFISTYNTMAHELYYSEITPEGVSSVFFNRLYRDGSRNIGSDGGFVYDSAESTLYWTNNKQYTVERYNLATYIDEVVFSLTSPGYPDMDIDPIERIIYLSGSTNIDYFPIDGETSLSTFMDVGYAIYDIIVDATNRYLYMAIYQSGNNVIQRVSLDDSNAVDVLKTDSSITPPVLALSPNKIYWLIGLPAFIQEANLDGSNARTLGFPRATVATVSSMELYDQYLLGIGSSGNIIQEMNISTEANVPWTFAGLENIERICKHKGRLQTSTIGTDRLQTSTMGVSALTETGGQKPSTMGMRTSTETDSEESSSVLVYVIIAVIVCVVIFLAIPAFICYRRIHSGDTNQKTNAVSFGNANVSNVKANLADEDYEVPMSTVNNAYTPPYEPPAPAYRPPVAPPVSYAPSATSGPPVPLRNDVDDKPDDDYLYMYPTIDQVGLYDNNIKK